MRIAANKAYCRVCRTALLTRKSVIPKRTSAKSVPRKKRTAATPDLDDNFILTMVVYSLYWLFRAFSDFE